MKCDFEKIFAMMTGMAIIAFIGLYCSLEGRPVWPDAHLLVSLSEFQGLSFTPQRYS